jgi:proteic killer suppression protein
VYRYSVYDGGMAIQSFSCADTQALFVTGRSARFANIKDVAVRKLAQLNAAPTIGFLSMPPGNDLKMYDGAWHIRINRQWRLIFKWGDNGPEEVKIDDPH